VTRASIFACRDPRGREWQLGPLPPGRGRLTLIGWSQPAETRDAGVPENVARVLARALTSVARVTFPSSLVSPIATSMTTVWSPLDGDLIRVLTAKGFGGRIVAKLRGTPPHIALMSTRRPETASRLFDDGAFPWWLQGQVVLLSEPDAPPPDIDEESLLALFGEEWTGRAASLAPAGVQGVVRPGVDGDVAGLVSLNDVFQEAVLTALETETRLAGFEWALLMEEAFALR
jgi:hypothetical protein